MREQRKAERVRILGAEIDPVRVDRALNLTSRYLELNKFVYITFVNTAAAILGQESPDFAQFLNQAALVLPGDKNIENAIDGNLKVGEDATYQGEYFERLFYKLNRMGASVYVMQEKEENLKLIEERFQPVYTRIKAEGVLWNVEENMDYMVNEINVIAPQVLIVCGHYKNIWKFLSEYGSKINVSLCICLEEISPGAEYNIPAWVMKFHLQGVYRVLYEKTKHIWTDSMFKKKMKESDLEQKGQEESSQEKEKS